MDALWKLDNAIFYFTAAAYLLAAFFYWLGVFVKFDLPVRFAGRLTLVGLAGNTLAIVARLTSLENEKIVFSYFKLVNSYEFLLLFTWFTVLLNVLLVRKYKFWTAGLFVMPLVFGLSVYGLITTDSLGLDLSALVVYRSNWLIAYSLTSALAYSSFAIAFCLALMYLLKDYLHRTNPRGNLAQRLPNSEVLDESAYRQVNHGFPFFSIALIFGCVWAFNAWGRFWSWEPKETWSFISWLAYMAYLHARLLYGWSGNRSAWMTVMGFLSVLFTFIGVTYFMPGQNVFNF